MKPQDVIVPPGGHAIFMVFSLQSGDNTIKMVKALCAGFAAIPRSMRTRFPGCGASAVMGFGATAWGALFPDQPSPKELTVFQEIRGPRHTAVSTPGDLFFHLRAERMDVCQEMAAILGQALNGAVIPVDEVQGFRYFDGRAIVGFVDGTENPEEDDRAEWAVIGGEDTSFRGGSYAFVQKYFHDMNRWNDLPVSEQEKVIGRRKFDDVELGDDEKPEDAHNAVTNISDDDGNELKIVRANMPFATPSKGEFGTYFIGYARRFSITRTMLERMFVGEPTGNTDRLLEFSTAVTGTLFFVPDCELLEQLGDD